MSKERVLKLDVIAHLKSQNEKYVNADVGAGDISINLIRDTAVNGQKPYAAILTCSDSRVIPEYIFMAGIGELFTVRNAGNIVGKISLASLEYAVDHLGVKVLVVMGHDYCGAVNAAVAGASGYISPITDVIIAAADGEEDIDIAINLNIENSIKEIMQSAVIAKAVAEGKTKVVGALYSTSTGSVEFFE